MIEPRPSVSHTMPPLMTSRRFAEYIPHTATTAPIPSVTIGLPSVVTIIKNDRSPAGSLIIKPVIVVSKEWSSARILYSIALADVARLGV